MKKFMNFSITCVMVIVLFLSNTCMAKAAEENDDGVQYLPGKKILYDEDGKYLETDYTYDKYGRIKKENIKEFNYKGELYSNELIKYTYSKKGRLIKQTNTKTEYKDTFDDKPYTCRTEITYKYKKGRLAEKTEIADNIFFEKIKDGTKFLYSYNKKGQLYKVKQYSFRIENNKIRHKELAVVERYYYYKNGQLKKYTSEDKTLGDYIYRKVDDYQYDTYQYDSMGNITQSEEKWTGNDYTYLYIANTKYKNTYKNGVLVKRRCNEQDYSWNLIKNKKKKTWRYIYDEYFNKNGDVYKTVWYQKDSEGKLVKSRVDKTSYKYYKGKYIKKKYVNGELTEEYSGYKKFKK